MAIFCSIIPINAYIKRPESLISGLFTKLSFFVPADLKPLELISYIAPTLSLECNDLLYSLGGHPAISLKRVLK